MSELKKCPFCGGGAYYDFGFFGRKEITKHYVECSCGCDTRGPLKDTKEEAIEVWNTRPDPKAELVEAIRNWRKHADFDDHEMRHVTLLDKVDSALESAINTIMGDTE